MEHLSIPLPFKFKEHCGGGEKREGKNKRTGILGFYNCEETPGPRQTFYKGKHFIGAHSQFQRFRPLLSWREAWHYRGRHGVGGAGNATS